MGSITSKYAVPFVNRRSTVIDNVLTRSLVYSETEAITEIKNSGVGYLKIILPSLPLDQNCIGFKISVRSPKKTLFEGHISGSSSDGYKWLYASVDQTKGSEYISAKTALFCHQEIDPSQGNKVGNILKSILIGDENTNWGTDVTVSIEYLSGTLETTPDGESNRVKTSSINEMTKISERKQKTSSGVVSPLNYTEGWRFEIGPKVASETVDTSINLPTSREGSDIELTGVVEGRSRTESGRIIIDTNYKSNEVDLRDADGNYGKIKADGSELVNLDHNPAFTGFVPESSKQFISPVTLENTAQSDASLRFTFQGPGDYKSSVRINKFNIGNWDTTNTKEFSVRTTKDPSIASSLSLQVGDIGLLDLGNNTDLFVGATGETRIVGGMKICMTDDELDSQIHFKGKTVFHNGVIKVSDGNKWVPMVLDSSGVIISMDSIDDGDNYKKIKSESVTEGEINRLISYYDSTPVERPEDRKNIYVTAQELRIHLDNDSIHVSSQDRARWNSYSESTGNTYTKPEVNDLLDKKSNVGHYHFYHDPVNLIINNDNEDLYPLGTRVLIKSLLVIRVSSGITDEEYEQGSSKWDKSKEELFKSGSVVVNLEDYKEYLNKDGVIVTLNDEIVTKEDLEDTLYNYVSGDKSYVLRTDNWSLSRTGRNLLRASISSSISSLSIGDGFNDLTFLSANKPTYDGKSILVEGDVDESKFAKKVHYHRNHEPIINIVSSLPTSNLKEGDRYILQEVIKERRGNSWVNDEALQGDIVFNINNNKIYKYNGSSWVGTSIVGGDKGITVDSKGDLVHTNSITSTTSPSELLYSIKLDSQGHVTEYRNVTSDDIPNLPVSKIIYEDDSKKLDYRILPFMSGSGQSFTPGVFNMGSGIGSVNDNYLTVDYLPSYSSSTVLPSTFKNDGLKYFTTTRSGLGSGQTGSELIDAVVFSKNQSGSLVNSLIFSKEDKDIYYAQGTYGSNSWSHVTKLGVQVSKGSSEPTTDQINSMKDGDFYILEEAYEV